MTEVKKEEPKKEEPKKEEPKEEKKELKGEFTVMTSDGKEMKATFEVLGLSEPIKKHYEIALTAPGAPLPVMPLPRVNSASFERIVKYYEYSKGKTIAKIEKPLKTNKLPDIIKDEWLRKFIDLPTKDLSELLMACDFLKLEDLKQLAACVIATRLFGKTPEEIRTEFAVDPELTPDQDKQLKRFFQWADQLWP